MIFVGRISLLVLLAYIAIPAGQARPAEEDLRTPSEQMKKAVGKLNKAPATIGQSLQDLTDAARDKLKQTFGGQAKSERKTKSPSLDVPRKDLTAPSDASSALKESERDPFRPMTLRTKVPTRKRENLSPLERFDLSQLKLVGIIWDVQDPRALVEDSAGLGYVVRVGTPIGNSDGKIKIIRRNEVVVEEMLFDLYGKPSKHDVSMKILTE